MKSTFYLLLITVVSLSACKKNTDQPPASPAPQANFKIDGQESASVTLKSTRDYYIENKSQNAVSFSWTLADGTTSTKKDEIFKFNKPGDYTVSLTAKNSSGETSVLKKQVKVVATVLRNITIQNIDWRSGDGARPKSNNADIWVEITKREAGVDYPSTGAYMMLQ
ncbi:PKD domain-containing protein [Pedobacter sp. NJ-S-72]